MSKTIEDCTMSSIPNVFFDRENQKSYLRKRFFGKGGFAKCYEIVDSKTKSIYAGKVIAKKTLTTKNYKEKIVQEISIHQSLKHCNIVGFHSFFEDSMNIYIILELCKNHSLMELHKRRKYITEYESRYYVYQLTKGVKYLHDNSIIHRDIKLGNVFLDDKLHLKIGDFGLATRVIYEGERKETLCGTPNYIAPEILTKKGHSFEVDIWSIGCVMYTLLVGKPPFETNTLKETYSKIKKCEYHVPSFIRKPAVEIIVAMLQKNPQNRPKINDLLKFEFLTEILIPNYLPTSCLTMEPRLGSNETVPKDFKQRKPLIINNTPMVDLQMDCTFLKANLNDSITISAQMKYGIEDCRHDIQCLHQQLIKLINNKPKVLHNDLGVENSDPEAQPLFWISKWVDYSDKYGFGYQLCDESIGVMFNDCTKLILLPNYINVHYIDRDGKESYMTSTDYCKSLEKKMRLLFYFKRYMTEHLVKTGAENVKAEGDVISRMPHLQTWFRTKCAVIMHLTNGTVQLNFSDHMKIVLCPRMSAVTYMGFDINFCTYRFSTILENGCPKDLYQKLYYACEKVGKMIEMMK